MEALHRLTQKLAQNEKEKEKKEGKKMKADETRCKMEKERK